MKVLKIVLIVLSFTSVIVVVYKILTKSENLSPLSQRESVSTVSPTSTATLTPISVERVRRMNRELEDDDD